MNREYVVVCNRHRNYACGDAFLFWGSYTKDKDKRSFGGYTSDLDECEKYTLDEVLNSGYHFKAYEPNSKWKTYDDFYISLKDLGDIGEPMTVVMKR